MLGQAITTRFLGPTYFKGSRVVAKAAAGRIIVDWDHRLNPEENHKAAAIALAKRLEWRGTWFGATLPDQNHVFVCVGLMTVGRPLVADFTL